MFRLYQSTRFIRVRARLCREPYCFRSDYYYYCCYYTTARARKVTKFCAPLPQIESFRILMSAVVAFFHNGRQVAPIKMKIKS